MTEATDSKITAGGAIFPRLKALGVDYVFCNSGTDFPPIIEGLAEAAAQDRDLPQALVIPHETAAMAMAQGYYLRTGRAQAVMVHTNVGLANAAIGAINAACERTPVLMMSGRTPVMESGRFGARTVPIGWGQEMRDQASLVRDVTKWDYELRFPEQIAGLLDRAHAIANSTPKGPVYLSLPREVLCEDVPTAGLDAPPSMQPVATAPDPAALADLARWLAEAEAPLVIAQRGAGSPETFAAFAEWAESWGIAVCSWWAVELAIATDHPCHVGADPGPWLARADVVLALDCLAPWMPAAHHPRADARIAQMGPDPLFARFPVRNFRADLTLAGEVDATLRALMAAMADLPRDEARIAPRRASLSDQAARRAAATVEPAAGTGLSKVQASRLIGAALEGEDATVFSELGAILGPLARRAHGSWFDAPHSGGLGWSFPAAMGAQLADRAALCVATMGDGSYMFANPTACHQIAEALDLPVLVIIFNNAEWDAVRRSVTALYPDGAAAQANRMPLVSLDPVPDFCRTAEASRAWARRVDTPDDLIAGLEAALKVVREDKRCALLDVTITTG